MHKRWSVWFNSTLSEEPYQGLKPQRRLIETSDFYKDVEAGAAWLLSACGVSCSVKSGNKRNPCSVLQVSRKTASFLEEEGEDDTKSAWPSDALGHTGATMANTMGC